MKPRIEIKGKNLFPATFHLTPLSATALILLAVVAGYRYRQNWQQEGPLWKAWVYGVIAGGSLVLLAFTPLKYGG
ncbi:MAG: hypothetical protein AAF346_06695 [Pseudomonadota bacterium]